MDTVVQACDNGCRGVVARILHIDRVRDGHDASPWNTVCSPASARDGSRGNIAYDSLVGSEWRAGSGYPDRR